MKLFQGAKLDSGRYISDSTTLIYDLLHAKELKNITGLLMLIDFEKAFDSLSRKFLYRVHIVTHL